MKLFPGFLCKKWSNSLSLLAFLNTFVIRSVFYGETRILNLDGLLTKTYFPCLFVEKKSALQCTIITEGGEGAIK